jgi:small subunit ribosomal protein S16
MERTLVATKIKLTRVGKMREPHYRVVVADARTKRDGRSIETIGEYHPKNDPSVIRIDADRAAYWLGVGAQPTEAVTAILKVTGDWQKFKGLPAPEPMKVAPPKADKRALFDAALKDSDGEPALEATTPKKRSAPRKDTAEAPAAEAPAAEAPAAEAAAVTEAPAGTEAPAAEAPAATTDGATTDGATTDGATTDGAEQ